MAEVTNPHDAFFKHFLSKPELAADFLRQHLPADLVAGLDLSALTLQKDSFIDVDLREHFTDLLYRIPLHTGEQIAVYLLFEHKSYPDKWVAFQVLRYMVRIWEQDQRLHNALLPIVPLVVYHGRVRWGISLQFSALFELLKSPEAPTLQPVENDAELTKIKAALRPYLPDFRYQLTNLSTLQDGQVRGEIWVRVFQLILKYIFADRFDDRLPAILGLAHELAQKSSGLEMLGVVVRYVAQAGQNLSSEDLRTAVAAALPADGGILMQTLAEQWIAEGVEKGTKLGRDQGLEQGLEQGLQAQRTTLLRILERRFKLSESESAELAKQFTQITRLEALTQLVDHALDAVVLADFTVRLQPYLPAPVAAEQSAG